MECKSSNEERHDGLVRILEERLTKEGFDCHTFINYSNRGLSGEIDLLAIKDTLPPLYHFYEVKCSCNPQKINKARRQYERYLEAYNLSRKDVGGFMVAYNTKRIPL